MPLTQEGEPSRALGWLGWAGRSLELSEGTQSTSEAVRTETLDTATSVTRAGRRSVCRAVGVGGGRWIQAIQGCDRDRRQR